MTGNADWLSTADAADAMGITARTLYRFIIRAAFPRTDSVGSFGSNESTSTASSRTTESSLVTWTTSTTTTRIRTTTRRRCGFRPWTVGSRGWCSRLPVLVHSTDGRACLPLGCELAEPRPGCCGGGEAEFRCDVGLVLVAGVADGDDHGDPCCAYGVDDVGAVPGGEVSSRSPAA